MFLYTISCMQGGHTTLTLIFIIFYMTAALLQVRTAGAWEGLPHTLPPLLLGLGWPGNTGLRGSENRLQFQQSHEHAV